MKRHEERVHYLTDKSHHEMLVADGTSAEIDRISELPHLASPVVVYPDASPKTLGFPAGLRLETEDDWLYPLAAPDLGCGYAVVDTGVQLPRRLPSVSLEAFLAGISASVGSPSRAEEAERMLLEGAGDPHSPWPGPNTENVHDWDAQVEGISDRQFTAIAQTIGRPVGHFVAIYALEQECPELAMPRGRLVLVVHTGASAFRAVIHELGIYERMALEALEAGLISPNLAALGLFPASLHSQLGRLFVGYASAARNFGYNNRLRIAGRALGILLRLLGPGVEQARLLRHVDHVAFERSDNGIVARRGLQRLAPSKPVFVTGGAHTRAFLCTVGQNPNPSSRGLAPHGAPVGRHTALRPKLSVQDRLWASCTVSNRPVELDQVAEDVSRLAGVIDYCTEAAWIQDAFLLRPVLNYREGH